MVSRDPHFTHQLQHHIRFDVDQPSKLGRALYIDCLVEHGRLKWPSLISGDFAGFDEKQPTCEQGGKTKVMQILKNKYSFKRLVHIGDGATDLEAAPPAVS